MKKLLLPIIVLLLSGCTQQTSQIQGLMILDCQGRGGEYQAETQTQNARCEFADESYCTVEAYNSDQGCYPEQTGKRELIECQGFESADTCTMQYDPVCAKIRLKNKDVWQTYSNACMACTSNTVLTEVQGYVKGACEDYAIIK